MLNDMPLISVIIPLYNSEKYVVEAIESVLNQSYKNIELVIVDDYSSDNSFEIAKRYEKIDKRVSVIRNEKNIGVAKTRNEGIINSCGEYIALLDSDDVWLANKLEIQMADILKHHANISYCSYKLIDGDGNDLAKDFIVPAVTSFDAMLVKNVISCSTVLAERDLFIKFLFSEEFYHEDYVLWMTWLRNNYKAVGNEKVLTLYRLLETSRSSSKIKAARNRWKIYREALGLSLTKSIKSFIIYAYFGIKKYY